MKILKVVLASVAIIVLLIILMAIELPHSVKAPCQVVSKAEWSLVRIQPDKFKSRLLDHKTGKILFFNLLQYQREDFVRFRMLPHLENDQMVKSGDTLAVLTSSSNQFLLAELRGELKKAEANLAMVSSGEKQAVQNEALQALEIAETQYEAFEPQYLRQKELFEKGLLSAAEWETAKVTYDIYRNTVKMQQARLEAVKSGEKMETIRYVRAHIKQLEEQIRIMESKRSQEIIRSPHKGILTFSGNDSLICKVERLDTLLIRMAIPVEKLKYLKNGQKINIMVSETGQTYEAFVTQLHKRSHIMAGRPVYFITGMVVDARNELVPGMSGFARIHADKMTIGSRLVKAFKRYAGTSLL